MHYLQFLIVSSFDDLKRNKVRTFLTSLGIMIGVLSVVLLIAFGVGLKNYIQNQFDSLGSNLIYVVPGKLISNGNFSSGARAVSSRFDDRDVSRLRKLNHVDYVVPLFQISGTFESKGKSEDGQLIGTTPDMQRAINFSAASGRFFTKQDGEKRAKVVAIGSKLAESLFGTAYAALGKSVHISGQTYRVIGVMKAKGGGGLGGPSFDTMAFAPYKSLETLNPEKKFYTMYVRARTEKDIPFVKAEITKTLSKRYEDDEFQVIEQTEILGIVTNIFSLLNSILVAIGSISLIVGGIGIMNIMYATVTERIKEIGIRRAIGATKSDVLNQFLCEAIILSIFGGLLGLGFAVVIVILIQPFFPAGINALSVFAALGVSSLIGIFFGVFPAKKAADLSPIEAIRYE